MAGLQSVIFKIAGRCNINCSYCYMFNLVDQSYADQPVRPSEKTVDSLFDWIDHYTTTKGLNSFHIALHGGEPLLAGVQLVTYIGEKTRYARQSTGKQISLSLLTNGLLLNETWFECLTEFDISFGISLDGPREVHDEFRLDKAGKGTHQKVESMIRHLVAHPEIAPTFSKSALAVIRPGLSGRELVHYFHRLGLAKVDFLLPDQNHCFGSDCYGKPTHGGEYAKVLIDAYEAWREIDDPDFHIRKFELLILAMFGYPIALDSIGMGPITVFTVEANGEIEPVDSMKICGDRFTKSGCNIRDWTNHDIEEIPLIKLGLQKDLLTPASCLSCRFLKQCGSGYLPHRFDGQEFRETVYCSDMKSLCAHIGDSVRKEVSAAKGNQVVA